MINQRNRMLRLLSPLGDDACVVTAFSGTEHISDVYRYQLTLQTKGLQIQPLDIMGVSVQLELLWGETRRLFHGMVDSWADIGMDADGTGYHQLTLAPPMALLALARHNRIFENLSTIDIVSKLFADCGQRADSSKLRSYRCREICTQYSETDLAFVNRLLAEEGISYFFKHDQDCCICVLVDMHSGFGNTLSAWCHYAPVAGDAANRVEAITAWRRHIRMSNEKLTITDYSECAPAAPVSVTAESRRSITRARRGEIQLYGQQYFLRTSDVARELDADVVAVQAARWQTALDGVADRFAGASTIAGVGAGLHLEVRTEISAHPTNVLVLSVEHHAADGNAQETFYRNSFVAVDAATGYVPVRCSARSQIIGTHIAQVVSVKDPACDGALGEVRVRFPWERGQGSCWARVAQLHAGSRWGSHFIPEQGQEVLVEFLNGDPDRPVVVGAVYNRNNLPMPYTRTQSGIRGSSKNFNELRFDDKEGSEELYIQAGRDHRYRVNNDVIGTINNNRNVTISNGNDNTVICNGDQRTDVGGNITIRAGQSITLQVGGSLIEIGPTGISVQGTVISLQGDAHVDMEAGAVVDIKGSVVRINS